MKIDAATGLPELPENHFWKVVDNSVGRGRGEIRYPYMTVELVHRNTHTIGVENRVEVEKPGTWRNLWKPVMVEEVRPGVTYEHVDTVLSRKIMVDIWTPKDHVNASELLKEGIKIEAPEGYTEFRSRDYIGFPMLSEWHREWEITPENILKAATILVEEYEEYVRKQKEKESRSELRKSFTGMYPPKKLSVAELS